MTSVCFSSSARLVRRPAWHSRGRRLIEERHWEVAEVERPRFNFLSLSEAGQSDHAGGESRKT